MKLYNETEYEQYEKVEVLNKAKTKRILFLKEKANETENYDLIVSKFDGEEYIQTWKQPIPEYNILKEIFSGSYWKKLEESRKAALEIERQRYVASIQEKMKKKAQNRQAYLAKIKKQREESKKMMEQWNKEQEEERERKKKEQEEYELEQEELLKNDFNNQEELFESGFEIKNPLMVILKSSGNRKSDSKYYLSEWLRRIPSDNDEFITPSDVMSACQKIYHVDIPKKLRQMSVSSSEKTRDNNYYFYIIQPYVDYEDKRHYFPKIIMQALEDNNITRRLKFIEQLQKYYNCSYGVEVYAKFNHYKDALDNFDKISGNPVDKEFIEFLNNKLYGEKQYHPYIIVDNKYVFNRKLFDSCLKEMDEYAKWSNHSDLSYAQLYEYQMTPPTYKNSKEYKEEYKLWEEKYEKYSIYYNRWLILHKSYHKKFFNINQILLMFIRIYFCDDFKLPKFRVNKNKKENKNG